MDILDGHQIVASSYLDVYGCVLVKIVIWIGPKEPERGPSKIRINSSGNPVRKWIWPYFGETRLSGTAEWRDGLLDHDAARI